MAREKVARTQKPNVSQKKPRARKAKEEEVVITVEIHRSNTPLSPERRAARDAAMADLLADLMATKKGDAGC